jgi:hypothetical protein
MFLCEALFQTRDVVDVDVLLENVRSDNNRDREQNKPAKEQTEKQQHSAYENNRLRTFSLGEDFKEVPSLLAVVLCSFRMQDEQQ